jgi:hypothetical protein
MNALEMAMTASLSAADWAKSGFAKTTLEMVKKRQEICNSCEFWNKEGFMGSGQCLKCGCSTYAKLRMATSKCPIDKWLPEDIKHTQ